MIVFEMDLLVKNGYKPIPENDLHEWLERSGLDYGQTVWEGSYGKYRWWSNQDPADIEDVKIRHRMGLIPDITVVGQEEAEEIRKEAVVKQSAEHVTQEPEKKKFASKSEALAYARSMRKPKEKRGPGRPKNMTGHVKSPEEVRAIHEAFAREHGLSIPSEA